MSRGQTLFFIPPAQHMSYPVDLNASLVKPYLLCQAHKPYFSYHVPSTRSLSCKHLSGPQTLFLIPCPVDPALLSCKHLSAHKPYFSYQLFERMPYPIDLGSFSNKYPLAYKPYFSYSSYYVISTRVHFYASVFWPTNLIFYTIFLSECVSSTSIKI